MKNTALLFISVFLLSTLQVTAQDCTFYYPKQEGATLEITNYNKKDKVTGKTIQKIKSVNESGDGLTATVLIASYDKKDNLLFESDMDVECEGDVFKVSMENYLNAESFGAFQEADMTVESDNLRYPANLTPGQDLNDGTVKVNVKSAGMPVMNLETTISNRKVEGKEEITTPAGTFDCYKITYDISTKVMISNMNFKAVEWISMDAGVVKSESYNKNGKLMGYTLLTDLDK